MLLLCKCLHLEKIWIFFWSLEINTNYINKSTAKSNQIKVAKGAKNQICCIYILLSGSREVLTLKNEDLILVRSIVR